ncbi:MAG: DUF2892 domain-containing protein [Nitrospirota bacterium]
MRENVGTIDRVIRAAVGIALFLAALAVAAPLARTILGLGGVIMLGTALVGFCPVYRVLGLNTCGQRRK